MGMVLGTALAAIAFTVLHYRISTEHTLAVWAGTGLIWHGQTPFSWSSGAATAGTLSSDCPLSAMVQTISQYAYCCGT
jgi:hypothetical protein